MDCREVRQLFSPRIDGELAPFQTQFFEDHLDNCDGCRKEFAFWEECSGALKELGEDVPAPAGLAAAVMTRVREEARPLAGRSRFSGWVSWKQLVAGAAAVAVLALGSMAPRLPLWHGPLQLAEETQNVPPASKHQADLPGVAKSPDATTVNPPEEVTPGNPTPTDGVPSTEKGPEQPPAQTGAEPSHGSGRVSLMAESDNKARVFLNTERTISSTLMKVAVANLEDSRSQALAMGNAAGATGLQVARQATGDKEFTIIRFVVAPARLDSLLGSLSGLGSVLTTQEEARDITRSFSDTLEQYQALVAQREATVGQAEVQRLDKQIEDLQKQLDTWDNEAHQHIVVLWLEAR